MIRAPRLPRPSRPVLLTILVTAVLAFPMGIVLASHQFTDVPNSNAFHNDIDALVDSGVTAGCGGGKYCPKSAVTREQMAAFLNRLGALAPGKTPVVNATTVDRLDANDIVRAADDLQFVNTSTDPTTASIMTATAPVNGGLLLTNSFTCISSSGTTDTRWNVDLAVDGLQIGGGSSELVLVFLHAAAVGTPGASATASTFVPVSAGTHTVSFTADRSAGDGSLDCNVYTTTLFVPFGDGGGLPAFAEEAVEGAGADVGN